MWKKPLLVIYIVQAAIGATVGWISLDHMISVITHMRWPQFEEQLPALLYDLDASWCHIQQDRASERTPLARTLPRVIGSIGSLQLSQSSGQSRRS